MEKRLDDIQKKGGIEFKIKNGKKHYCTAPLVVGMYEFQIDRLTPEFIKDFNAYTSDMKFGIEFLSTGLPQMRTIPVAESIHKKLPRPLEFWASNFQAVVDADACIGCGSCEDTCQVGAVNVPEKEDRAVVNLDRCLGCGVCIPNCPTDATSLLKNPMEVTPPQSREELYEIIMDKKKGKFGKALQTGKLLIDVVRTGQTNLLKKT